MPSGLGESEKLHLRYMRPLCRIINLWQIDRTAAETLPTPFGVLVMVSGEGPNRRQRLSFQTDADHEEVVLKWKLFLLNQNFSFKTVLVR